MAKSNEKPLSARPLEGQAMYETLRNVRVGVCICIYIRIVTGVKFGISVGFGVVTAVRSLLSKTVSALSPVGYIDILPSSDPIIEWASYESRSVK
jgi:hypothetical protein